MKLIEIWEKLGKQPLRVTQHKDAIVFVNGEKYEISGIAYDSGKFIGFETTSKNQWYQADVKPEMHRWVIVKDKYGEEYNDYQWNGHAWYAYTRGKDGYDGWRSDIDIVEWRYQD